ncbi:MEDS domain-containing protein [Pseudonocardia sp. H11422]|uniref:MEDS domain-containing protein n=1 Tax=Pseudonocardia sp. H11422 TaxID=2835866 RepID=UPI001BDBCD63|nr:MEDS domain-containing protein [Pseudonocardia sp. H11422]
MDTRSTAMLPIDTPSPPGAVPPAAYFDQVPLHIHDHLCAFVHRRSERDRLLLPYLHDGLRAGQACLCVLPTGAGAAVTEVLADAVPAGCEYLLQVVDPSSCYLRTGRFDPAATVEFFDIWTRSAVERNGGKPVRIACDMSWAHELISPSFVQDLAGYEARFDRWARFCPQVSVCLYDLEQFGGSVLIPVIRTHPRVWLSGVVVDNPYCTHDPYSTHDEALATQERIPVDRDKR